MSFLRAEIGGIPYSVVVKAPAVHEDVALRTLGHVSFSCQIVTVDPDQAPESLKATVLHEFIHAMLYQAGIQEHDEALLDVLAYGMVSAKLDGQPLVNPMAFVGMEAMGRGGA